MTAHEPSGTLPLDEKGRLKSLFALAESIEKVDSLEEPAIEEINGIVERVRTRHYAKTLGGNALLKKMLPPFHQNAST